MTHEQRARAPLKLYNTLTRTIEPFMPITPGKVNLFVCGPTVYDYPHLGHAKTYTHFDLLARVLRSHGYEVFYLQNITDIDDKIIKRAREEGIGWKELALHFEKVYLEDMAALRNNQVTKFARATDHIDAIVKQVEALQRRGYAYDATDGIYFEIAQFAGYGKLSRRTDVRSSDAVSRIDDGKGKRAWNDFCLWKSPKPDEPSWDTPIGAGRPGWHIEDTAITETYFGPQYDIHGGAVDLIIPHHEAEIAQMEAASGRKPLVRFWLHTGFLNTATEKMSKSLGNFTSIRSTLERYDYRTLRFMFLNCHYRSALEFTPTVLDQAAGAVKRLEEFYFVADAQLDDVRHEDAVANLRRRIDVALSDDLDTPAAFAALFEFVRQQNSLGGNGRRVRSVLEEIDTFFEVLPARGAEDEAEIEALVAKRLQYRQQRRFAEADRVRDELAARGIQIYDAKGNAVRWRRVSASPAPIADEVLEGAARAEEN
jgi:cysteinyl-tRNA synthetase